MNTSVVSLQTVESEFGKLQHYKVWWERLNVVLFSRENETLQSIVVELLLSFSLGKM